MKCFCEGGLKHRGEVKPHKPPPVPYQFSFVLVYTFPMFTSPQPSAQLQSLAGAIRTNNENGACQGLLEGGKEREIKRKEQTRVQGLRQVTSRYGNLELCIL